MTALKTFLYPFTAVMILVLATCGCKEKVAQAPPPPPEVEFVTVEQKDVPVYQEWVGTLDGDVNATINAQVSGYLIERAYNEGSMVKKGDVLFRIDPASFEAALAQAKATLAHAQAVKGKTQVDVERYRPLAKTDAISQKELDNAIQADLAADANIEGAQAAVQQAELNLGFTTIKSPVDGMAGLAKAQIGDLVGPSTGALTTVARIKPIRAYFSVSEQMIYDIFKRRAAEGGEAAKQQEGTLELMMANGDVYPEKGSVRFSGNQVNVKTGTVEVVGVFPNADALLVPGMFARVRALVDVNKGALLVPQRAITELQGRFLIAIIGADNKVAVRPVMVGERLGTQWVVQSKDLKAGDRIVAEGVQKVRDGSTVTPRPLGAAARTPAAETQPEKKE